MSQVQKSTSLLLTISHVTMPYTFVFVLLLHINNVRIKRQAIMYQSVHIDMPLVGKQYNDNEKCENLMQHICQTFPGIRSINLNATTFEFHRYFFFLSFSCKTKKGRHLTFPLCEVIKYRLLSSVSFIFKR